MVLHFPQRLSAPVAAAVLCASALWLPLQALAQAPAADPPVADPDPVAPLKPEAEPEAKPADKPLEPAEKNPDVANPAANLDEAYGLSNDVVPPGGRLVWARNRQIEVYQKREMLKESRHAFSLLIGAVPNDDFFIYFAPGLVYQYYFSEDLGLRVQAAYTTETKTSLEANLHAPRPDGPALDVRLPQTLQAYANAGVDWNLLHGKMGFFGTRMTEFDLAINVGLGIVETRTTDQGAQQKLWQPKPAGNAGMALQFYLSQNLAVSMNYQQIFYAAYGGGVSQPIVMSLALTYLTSGQQ